jgi:hypothetical protein
MTTKHCKICGEEIEVGASAAFRVELCDECDDSDRKIKAGRFHDPDLLARDREERPSW